MTPVLQVVYRRGDYRNRNTGENHYFQPQPKRIETHFAFVPGPEFTPLTRVQCSPCCHEHPAAQQLPQHVLPPNSS